MTYLVAAIVFAVIAAIAIKGISRIEIDGPERDELTTAEDLIRIERELAAHGSFGRNLADRELA